MDNIKKQNSPAGYSGTPLSKKLGLKEGQKVFIKNMPENFFDLLHPLPENISFLSKLGKDVDVIHLFTKSTVELSKSLIKYRTRIKQNGFIWVSWPKKSSKVITDISEDTIRASALPLGFVDIKVCAVDDIWSGLKLVIRINNRNNKI